MIEKLMTIYMRGWHDCADNVDFKVREEFAPMEQTAYNIGWTDFLVGDDLSSIDEQTEDEIILKIAKPYFTMSTTFGIKITPLVYVKDLEDLESFSYPGMIEIVVRYAIGLGGGTGWVRKRAYTLIDELPDSTEVFALDNSPQGINNLGDIRKEIKRFISHQKRKKSRKN